MWREGGGLAMGGKGRTVLSIVHFLLIFWTQSVLVDSIDQSSFESSRVIWPRARVSKQVSTVKKQNILWPRTYTSSTKKEDRSKSRPRNKPQQKSGKSKDQSKTTKIPKFTITRHDLSPRHLGQLLGNESLKIVFCPIEKIMSTQFKQLFDRISGDNLWFDHPYHKNRYHIMLNKSKEEVESIMKDPTWTKAVIFRDPTKRLLSSYLHLVKAPDAIKRYKTRLLERNRSTTWLDFWQSALSGMKNIHWEPQTNFCGLRKFWPYFNYVGNYEMIQQHGPELARITGLNPYTDLGWALTRNSKYPLGKKTKNRTQTILSYPVPSDYNQGDCMWCKNRAQHQTNYSSYPIESYITPEVWSAIRSSELYKFDYEIFSKIKALPFNFSIYDHYHL